jgi:hypothetical protein
MAEFDSRITAFAAGAGRHEHGFIYGGIAGTMIAGLAVVVSREVQRRRLGFK